MTPKLCARCKREPVESFTLKGGLVSYGRYCFGCDDLIGQLRLDEEADRAYYDREEDEDEDEEEGAE